MSTLAPDGTVPSLPITPEKKEMAGSAPKRWYRIFIPGLAELSAGEKTHLARLDVLRGIAILSVFCYHWLWMIFTLDHLPWNRGWRDWNAAPNGFLFFLPVSYGWAAVPLFFVLSGFVIHLSTLKAEQRGKEFQVGTFYARRFWRIFPVYFLACICFSFALHLSPLTPRGRYQLVMHLLFLHNFSSSTFFSLSPAFWSLASEMQFYLIYPALLLLRKRFGMTRCLVGAFCISGAAIIACSLFIGGEGTPWGMQWWWSPLITAADWILGLWLAERYVQNKPVLRLPPLLIFGCVLLFLLSDIYRPIWTLSFHLAAILSGLWIDRVARMTTPLRLWERILLPVGIVSYSLYVWHQPFLPALYRLTGKLLGMGSINLGHGTLPERLLLMFTGGVPAFLVVYLLACASYHYLERPGVELGQWVQQRFSRRVITK